MDEDLQGEVDVMAKREWDKFQERSIKDGYRKIRIINDNSMTIMINNDKIRS